MHRERIETWAQALDQAWTKGQPIPPLSEEGLTGLEAAYAVQQHWRTQLEARGERVVGRKIGLTAKAVQQQFGVDQPDFGSIWASRQFAAQAGRAEVDHRLFLQPRVEGELAFLLGQPLKGPYLTPQEVLAATEAVAYAFEIVDSRIADWRIKIEDTVADNASFGALVLGPWQRSLLGQPLHTLGMALYKDGALLAQGAGAACLGHPARAVAWLVNKLAEFGEGLAPGDVVLSGSWIPVQPAAPGALFVLEAAGASPLTLRFT